MLLNLRASSVQGKRPHNATTAVPPEEDGGVSVCGSPAVIRRRLGVVDNPNKEDNLSPGKCRRQPSTGSGNGVRYFHDLLRVVVSDVTPNGSLRRRRSRVPSEEDEVTLMDFLRTSNQDAPPVSNVQRKSWGSLGSETAKLILVTFSGEPSTRITGQLAGSMCEKPWLKRVILRIYNLYVIYEINPAYNVYYDIRIFVVIKLRFASNHSTGFFNFSLNLLAIILFKLNI